MNWKTLCWSWPIENRTSDKRLFKLYISIYFEVFFFFLGLELPIGCLCCLQSDWIWITQMWAHWNSTWANVTVRIWWIWVFYTELCFHCQPALFPSLRNVALRKTNMTVMIITIFIMVVIRNCKLVSVCSRVFPGHINMECFT